MLRVEIELPEEAKVELEGLTNKQLRYLLMDALAEFVSHRGPTPEDYVNRRYPDTPSYSWLNREEKVRQVRWRCHVAETLRLGQVRLVEEPDPHRCPECGGYFGDYGTCVTPGCGGGTK